MTKILAAGAVLAIAFFALVAVSHAALYPSAKLNTIASAVAGKPIAVACETDPGAWDAYAAPKWRGYQVDGLTYISDDTIHIAPIACIPLLNDVLPGGSVHLAGTYGLALGITVLLHESQHAKGVVDEGVADCNALALIPQYLAQFGVPAKVARYTLKGKTYVKTMVKNPDVAQIIAIARAMHKSRGAAYQGGC